MRYFASFYHFRLTSGYSTGIILSTNDVGKFVSDEFVLSTLNKRYGAKAISEIEITQTVELTEPEWTRLNELFK